MASRVSKHVDGWKWYVRLQIINCAPIPWGFQEILSVHLSSRICALASMANICWAQVSQNCSDNSATNKISASNLNTCIEFRIICLKIWPHRNTFYTFGIWCVVPFNWTCWGDHKILRLSRHIGSCKGVPPVCYPVSTVTNLLRLFIGQPPKCVPTSSNPYCATPFSKITVAAPSVLCKLHIG